jgi:hypothetical protein
MIDGLLSALHTLRPRTLAATATTAVRTGTLVDELRTELREWRRRVKSLQEQQTTDRTSSENAHASLARSYRETSARHQAEIEHLRDRLAALAGEVAVLRTRESQLRAIAQRDGELGPQLEAAQQLLSRVDPGPHVRSAVAAAHVHEDPFPYAVVDQALPAAFYEALLLGLPPLELFADRPVNDQRIRVPPTFAPAYSRLVWGHLAHVVAPRHIMPAVLEAFREPLRRWLAQNFPAVDPRRLAALEMNCSDGRILLRRPGYYIPPHRDPKWSFITCLMYLPRPNDDPNWGTDIYSVADDGEAPDVHTHWIEEARCRMVGSVAFVPNRILVFLNSVGAHGARIPSDAPASVERYAYQFRIGPTSRAMASLLESLPVERRPLWEGKRGHWMSPPGGMHEL